MPKQKSILIVAAERGLGLGLAGQFFDRRWSIVGTARTNSDDMAALHDAGKSDPERLSIEYIDVTDAEAIPSSEIGIGSAEFAVIFMNACIYGPLSKSVLQATTSEIMESFITNTVGPVLLARSIMHRLNDKGTLCFMSSHRASIDGNVRELKLYRPSKSAQNMLSRGIFAAIGQKSYTVLNIHPDWVSTAMGTLNGTVAAEIDIETSVRGVADGIERRLGSGKQLYLDYQDRPLW